MDGVVIPRIVFTGGPCGGKSVALDRVQRHLETHRVKVYHVPEAATILLRGGILVKNAPMAHMVNFQRGIVRVQLALEDALDSFARLREEKAVLLCDRGVMDGAAYLPTSVWQKLLREEGLNETNLREKRYTAVIHMVTAAHGVEDSYSTHSNAVRYEDADGARQVDERLRKVWRGHPRFSIIDTHPDFEEKVRRAVAVVCDLVGVPPPS